MAKALRFHRPRRIARCLERSSRRTRRSHRLRDATRCSSTQPSPRRFVAIRNCSSIDDRNCARHHVFGERRFLGCVTLEGSSTDVQQLFWAAVLTHTYRPKKRCRPSSSLSTASAWSLMVPECWSSSSVCWSQRGDSSSPHDVKLIRTGAFDKIWGVGFCLGSNFLLPQTLSGRWPLIRLWRM
jgi:hypothetical protein